MSTVREATQAILDSPDPAGLLRLAEGYMDFWAKQPSKFVLPREHLVLEPVINTFAAKRDTFFKYVMAIRDELAHDKDRTGNAGKYEAMQRLYRTLEVRVAQRIRRERLRSAAEWFIRTDPQVPTAQRNVWLRRLEQKWARQRLQYLAAHRKQAGGALKEDERRAHLDDFWRVVDDQLRAGDFSLNIRCNSQQGGASQDAALQ